MSEIEVELIDEAATVALGQALAKVIASPISIHLKGDLGAGKTTFCRGFINALGHNGKVKSPTYTLVEPYELAPIPVYHFDLYRLADPEELEFLGVEHYFDGHAICIIEWPERANAMIPDADLLINLAYNKQGRKAKIERASESITNALKDLKERLAKK